MRRGAVVALLVLAGACRGKATPSEAPPARALPSWALPTFDIDIEVTEGRTDRGQPDPEARLVSVSLTDLGAGCVHSATRRPEPGQCGGWSDVREPPCGSWRCLREIRLEQAGRVLDRVTVPGEEERRDWPSARLHLPAHTSGARVVIEGCGQRAELPISTELPAAPEVTRVTRGAVGYEVAWTGAEDADMFEVSEGNGYGGSICARRERGPVKVALGGEGFSGLGARSAIVEQATPFGPAHLWRTARTRFEYGLFPADNEARYALTALVEHDASAAPFRVDVHMQALDENCSKGPAWPPPVGTCRPSSDELSGSCGAPGCLTGLRLEVNGVRAVAIDHLRRERREPHLELPTVPAGARVELVIEGCARDSARIPLPTEPLAAPAIQRFTQVGDDFTFAWSGSPGAASFLAAANDVISGNTCHAAGRGPVTVQKHGGERARATLRAVAASEPVDTSFGRVRLWRVSPAATPP